MTSEPVRCPYSNNGGDLPCLSGELVDYCHGECYCVTPDAEASHEAAMEREEQDRLERMANQHHKTLAEA